MFIPGFGVPWGMYAAWETGMGFQAIVITNPAFESVNPLSLIFMSPYGLMEVTAYSIAMSRSFLMIFPVIKLFKKTMPDAVSTTHPRSIIKRQLRMTCIEITVAVMLLFIGGFIEYTAIS